MYKRLVSLSLLLSLTFASLSFAQMGVGNIGSVKVDNMSDTQIQGFVNKFKSSGHSMSDLESYAKGKGMSDAEFEKLRARMENIDKKSAALKATQVAEAVREDVQSGGTSDIVPAVEEPKSRIFGADLFRNSKMTFEPNSNMATPRNYQIGPGDELVVDVYGFSENTMRLTVSSEGTVRVPNVGLVQVSGMTIEKAEMKIRTKLSSIYNTISSGKTTVSVSLGNIRSIKVYISGQVRNPGTYTLSSLSTVYNALYACGGPSESGSLRNIRVLRGGKLLAEVDLYSFLLNGSLENNLNLNDQDVIQVPPYESRVMIDGAMKITGAFEMKPNESLKDLIRFAGGFKENAYKNRISVVRNTEKEKSVADVSQELYSMFYPQSGDKFLVDSILDKFTNRVQILGNVFRPGIYALDDKMTLKDLISKADGLREDAYMERATVTRLREDLTPELISFDVQDLIDGKFNLELRKEDIVTIGSKHDLEENKTVGIYGQVLSPGVYPYYENMTLKDLIFLANGFKEFAATDKIEISRRIVDETVLKEDVDKMEIITLSVDRALGFGADGEFVLQPRDQVSVRMMEGMEDTRHMDVLGEVRSPGNYVITSKRERISDVLARAGGLSDYAYPKGAFLIRKTNRSVAERMRDLKLIQQLAELAEGEDRGKIEKELSGRTDLVGIDLVKILDKPGSESDPFVENGDIVFVPKELQTVTVSGAVQVPSKVLYGKSRFKSYINQSGGFLRDADKRHAYVAYANGSIASTKRFLWMRFYPDVEPGAHIFVPEKEEKDNSKSKENISFFTSILGSLVSMASVVVSVILISKE